jgi:succinyl-CoA synthetase beta subunit
MAVDCKVTLDDNALFRHPDLAEMRDLNEEDPVEIEAGKYNLNFIKLDGNVGCMVNGAGLAMATMDIIKLSGGSPANFLDVGGGASAETVEAGFRIILKDPAVKAILINIFGGIVRCDRVANGVVEAYKSVGKIKVPVIIRLQGTNAEEGRKIIDDSGLEVYSAVSFSEAAEKVSSVLKVL